MAGRHRRWFFAGVAAIAALLCVGGVALAGRLVSSPRAPLFKSDGAVATHLGRRAPTFLVYFANRTEPHTPADGQYRNPLEEKLCASATDIHFTIPPLPVAGTFSIESGVAIKNCGDVPLTLGAPKKANPSSPFTPTTESFENFPECPRTTEQLPLQPGETCVLEITFPGIPWPPAGDYEDTFTFKADHARVRVHLSGTVLAAPVLDQSFISPSGLSSAINECCRFVAQTFTAGRTGVLAGININVLGSVSTTRLHVAIRTVADGKPTAVVLGETVLDSGSAPLSQLITFPGSIAVTAGVQYAIVVNYDGAPAPGPGQVQGNWGGAVGDAYPSGALFYSVTDGVSWSGGQDGFDLHFQTYVSTSERADHQRQSDHDRGRQHGTG